MLSSSSRSEAKEVASKHSRTLTLKSSRRFEFGTAANAPSRPARQAASKPASSATTTPARTSTRRPDADARVLDRPDASSTRGDDPFERRPTGSDATEIERFEVRSGPRRSTSTRDDARLVEARARHGGRRGPPQRAPAEGHGDGVAEERLLEAAERAGRREALEPERARRVAVEPRDVVARARRGGAALALVAAVAAVVALAVDVLDEVVSRGAELRLEGVEIDQALGEGSSVGRLRWTLRLRVQLGHFKDSVSSPGARRPAWVVWCCPLAGRSCRVIRVDVDAEAKPGRAPAGLMSKRERRTIVGL